MEVRSYPATPDALERLATKLGENGIAFDPKQPTGEAEREGFQVQWKIDSGRIEVTMLKHPFIGAGIFWKQIEKELGPQQ